MARVAQEIKEKNQKKELNQLRLAADQIFGLLVKYGLKQKSLHIQIESMNSSEKKSAYEVNEESMLPEMVRSRVMNQLARFQIIDLEDGEYTHIGEREFIITDKNILEPDEAAEDAKEYLNNNFVNEVYSVLRTRFDDSGKPRKRKQKEPGIKFQRATVQQQLSGEECEMIITLQGMKSDEVQDLIVKLKQKEVLKNIPIFNSTDTDTGKEISMKDLWYEAFDDYYEARQALAEEPTEQ